MSASVSGSARAIASSDASRRHPFGPWTIRLPCDQAVERVHNHVAGYRRWRGGPWTRAPEPDSGPKRAVDISRPFAGARTATAASTAVPGPRRRSAREHRCRPTTAPVAVATTMTSESALAAARCGRARRVSPSAHCRSSTMIANGRSRASTAIAFVNSSSIAGRGPASRRRCRSTAEKARATRARAPPAAPVPAPDAGDRGAAARRETDSRVPAATRDRSTGRSRRERRRRRIAPRKASHSDVLPPP